MDGGEWRVDCTGGVSLLRLGLAGQVGLGGGETAPPRAAPVARVTRSSSLGNSEGSHAELPPPRFPQRLTPAYRTGVRTRQVDGRASPQGQGAQAGDAATQGGTAVRADSVERWAVDLVLEAKRVRSGGVLGLLRWVGSDVCSDRVFSP